MQRIPVTIKGMKMLREELEFLKHTKRPAITQAIAEARALGDLKENAEYHAAREEQSFAEGRIIDLENKISLAEVIDISKIPNEGRVIFGSTVTLSNIDTQEEVTYQIVGNDEAKIEQQQISISAPIARALIRKEEGDVVTVLTPSGEVHYEILQVHY